MGSTAVFIEPLTGINSCNYWVGDLNSDIMNDRKAQLKNILGSLSPIDAEELKKVVREAPPHKLSEFSDDLLSESREFTIQTPNKSFPYLTVSRDLELDKDQEPIYSFRFVSNYFMSGDRDIFHGSFGVDEVLDALNEMSSPRIPKGKPKKEEISSQIPFEL